MPQRHSPTNPTASFTIQKPKFFCAAAVAACQCLSQSMLALSSLKRQSTPCPPFISCLTRQLTEADLQGAITPPLQPNTIATRQCPTSSISTRLKTPCTAAWSCTHTPSYRTRPGTCHRCNKPEGHPHCHICCTGQDLNKCTLPACSHMARHKPYSSRTVHMTWRPGLSCSTEQAAGHQRSRCHCHSLPYQPPPARPDNDSFCRRSLGGGGPRPPSRPPSLSLTPPPKPPPPPRPPSRSRSLKLLPPPPLPQAPPPPAAAGALPSCSLLPPLLAGAASLPPAAAVAEPRRAARTGSKPLRSSAAEVPLPPRAGPSRSGLCLL